MRTFMLGDAEHAIDANALCPFIYSEEFTCTGKNGKKVPEDIMACMVRVGEAATSEDGMPPLFDIQKLWWTFEKAANPKTPSFRVWLRNLPHEAINIGDEGGWARQVMDEMMDGFFPGHAKKVVEAPSA